MREQPRHSLCARVFQPAAVAAHAHRHLGFLGGDAEFAEQPQQVRVGPLVVDQKARVEPGEASRCQCDVVGVGVPAEPVVGLEQLHVEAALQQVGGGQAGHPAADHGDAGPDGWRAHRYGSPSPGRDRCSRRRAEHLTVDVALPHSYRTGGRTGP